MYVSTFGRGISEARSVHGWAYTDLQIHNSDFELFPSPNPGSFTLRVVQKDALRETLQLEITDVTGGQGKEQGTYRSTLVYQISTGLPPGMYFAKIKGKKTEAVKSFIVK